MIFMVFVHLFSVMLLKAYRPPRELTWMTGVGLLFVAIGLGFTGYLLPWNDALLLRDPRGDRDPRRDAGRRPVRAQGAEGWRRRDGRDAHAVLRAARLRAAGARVHARLAPRAARAAARHGVPPGVEPRAARSDRSGSFRTFCCAIWSGGSPRSPSSPPWPRSSPRISGRRPTRSRPRRPASGPSGTSCSCSRRSGICRPRSSAFPATCWGSRASACWPRAPAGAVPGSAQVAGGAAREALDLAHVRGPRLHHLVHVPGIHVQPDHLRGWADGGSEKKKKKTPQEGEQPPEASVLEGRVQRWAPALSRCSRRGPLPEA